MCRNRMWLNTEHDRDHVPQKGPLGFKLNHKGSQGRAELSQQPKGESLRNASSQSPTHTRGGVVHGASSVPLSLQPCQHLHSSLSSPCCILPGLTEASVGFQEWTSQKKSPCAKILHIQVIVWCLSNCLVSWAKRPRGLVLGCSWARISSLPSEEERALGCQVPDTSSVLLGQNKLCWLCRC